MHHMIRGVLEGGMRFVSGRERVVGAINRK